MTASGAVAAVQVAAPTTTLRGCECGRVASAQPRRGATSHSSALNLFDAHCVRPSVDPAVRSAAQLPVHVCAHAGRDGSSVVCDGGGAHRGESRPRQCTAGLRLAGKLLECARVAVVARGSGARRCLKLVLWCGAVACAHGLRWCRLLRWLTRACSWRPFWIQSRLSVRMCVPPARLSASLNECCDCWLSTVIGASRCRSRACYRGCASQLRGCHRRRCDARRGAVRGFGVWAAARTCMHAHSCCGAIVACRACAAACSTCRRRSTRGRVCWGAPHVYVSADAVATRSPPYSSTCLGSMRPCRGNVAVCRCLRVSPPVIVACYIGSLSVPRHGGPPLVRVGDVPRACGAGYPVHRLLLLRAADGASLCLSAGGEVDEPVCCL